MSNAATQIRKDLKAAGFASRSISVKTSKTGSVRVEIKDASIPAEKVKEIAYRQQKIDRCETTGEILSGGNTFVFVGYARGALKVAGEELTVELQKGRRHFGNLEVDGVGQACVWGVWIRGEVGRFVQQISPNDGEALAKILAERGELQGWQKKV
jgi:hypothetical protein